MKSRMTSSQIIAVVDVQLASIRERAPKELHGDIDRLIELTQSFLTGRDNDYRS